MSAKGFIFTMQLIGAPSEGYNHGATKACEGDCRLSAFMRARV
jgi:hypothetical protein